MFACDGDDGGAAGTRPALPAATGMFPVLLGDGGAACMRGWLVGDMGMPGVGANVRCDEGAASMRPVD